MKILMLNHNLRGRGTWHRAWQLGRELARRGHAVTIWTVSPEHWYRAAEEKIENVRVVETPSWSPFAPPDDGWGPLGGAWRKWRVLAEDFDLCYAFAHAPNVFAPAWMSKWFMGKPLVYDWCDWYEGGVFPKRDELRRAGLAPAPSPAEWLTRRFEIMLERAMPRLAGRVTVISELLRDLAIEYGAAPEDVLLLPNGANTETIRPRDKSECRAALGVPPDAECIGYVANYHPDQAMFLASFARAAALRPGLKMLMAGPPFDAGLAARLGLESSIMPFGWCAQDKIETILGASDAMALPLEDNAFNRSRMPFKFGDYLAAGRAIVANPVGDLAVHFAPAAPRIGLAAAPQPESFGAALAAVFADATTREVMGAAARRLAETELSWARQADRLEVFLGRAAAG